MAQPVFYFDFAAPEAYLAAERSHEALGVVPEWRPVRLSAPAPDEAERARLTALAAERGLQPLRWPPMPLERELALLAATYAMGIGKVVAFSLAAFRQAYAGGRSLDETTTLIAGAACEMHPRALLKALELRNVQESLERATAEARALGIEVAPAVVVAGEVFHGDAGLEGAGARRAA